MKLLRLMAIVSCALLLSGCQPPIYHLSAVMKGASLFIDADFSGPWPFRWDKEDTDATYLEVATRKEILWAISASRAPGCATHFPGRRLPETERIDFPVVYGVAPPCFVTVRPAKPLPTETLILIRASGRVTGGRGLFQLERQVRAMDEEPYDFSQVPTLNPYWPTQPYRDLSAPPADHQASPAARPPDAAVFD